MSPVCPALVAHGGDRPGKAPVNRAAAAPWPWTPPQFGSTMASTEGSLTRWKSSSTTTLWRVRFFQQRHQTGRQIVRVGCVDMRQIGGSCPATDGRYKVGHDPRRCRPRRATARPQSFRPAAASRSLRWSSRSQGALTAQPAESPPWWRRVLLPADGGPGRDRPAASTACCGEGSSTPPDDAHLGIRSKMLAPALGARCRNRRRPLPINHRLHPSIDVERIAPQQPGSRPRAGAR